MRDVVATAGAGLIVFLLGAFAWRAFVMANETPHAVMLRKDGKRITVTLYTLGESSAIRQARKIFGDDIIIEKVERDDD